LNLPGVKKGRQSYPALSSADPLLATAGIYVSTPARVNHIASARIENVIATIVALTILTFGFFFFGFLVHKITSFIPETVIFQKTPRCSGIFFYITVIRTENKAKDQNTKLHILSGDLQEKCTLFYSAPSVPDVHSLLAKYKHNY